MEQVLLISLFSGLATGIGGLIVIWFGQPSPRLLSFYLGLSTGMMGTVVLVDLIPASLNYGSLTLTLTGLSIGIAIMFLFDKLSSLLTTYLNLRKKSKENRNYRQLGYFMTFAIALHNLPEGLAIGAGFESQNSLGIRIALIIALHNIPEGLGVASTLYMGKLRPLYIFLLPLATGFFIPIGTIIGSLISAFVTNWISIGLAVAGGAMGYLVIKEVGPESLKLNRLFGQFGIVSGIILLSMVYYLHY